MSGERDAVESTPRAIGFTIGRDEFTAEQLDMTIGEALSAGVIVGAYTVQLPERSADVGDWLQIDWSAGPVGGDRS